MKKILAINASYRNNGITDQTVEALRQAVETLGGEVEVVKLREYPLEFCRNCRECTQRTRRRSRLLCIARWDAGVDRQDRMG